MIKCLLISFILISTLCAVELNEQDANQEFFNQQGLKINHWVLAQPNGKPITVLDLAKRLEMAFRQQYPQYASNRDIRFQFYSTQWSYLLNEMVNNELMLADAKEKKMQVNDGDVRREVEEMFGPNVVQTIDEIGLSYEEALEIVRTNLIVNRMRGYMVTSRAMTSITPDQLQQAFEAYLEENPPEDHWKYQILSLRHSLGPIAESAAINARALLKKGLSLKELEEKLKEQQQEGLLAPKLSIRLSEVQERPTNSLAKIYRKALDGMEPGTISPPVLQVSKNGTTVCRLFHLVSYEKDDPPTFADLENELQGQLFAKAAEQEQKQYIAKLRDHFKVADSDEMIPRGFQPFSIY